MSYFDLFGIPSQFKIEPNLLKKRLQELNKEYQPDFYREAYETLQNEDATIQYILSQRGMLPAGEKYLLDAAFLTKLLDLDETLWALLGAEPDAEKLTALENETREIIKNSRHDVEIILDSDQEGISSEKELLQVKDYYYRKKYLERILDKIAALRNIAARR